MGLRHGRLTHMVNPRTRWSIFLPCSSFLVHDDILLRWWLPYAQRSSTFLPWGIKHLFYHRWRLWLVCTWATLSGYQRWLYIVVGSHHGFQVLNGLFQVLILDFDGAFSLVYRLSWPESRRRNLYIGRCQNVSS